MKTLKNIGIVAYPINGGYGIPTSYLNFFSKFGHVTMITHNEVDVRYDLDLLVLPGGPDVDPARYLDNTDELSLFIGKSCPFRERFDRVLLPKYIDAGISIFGICRGHQSLAVYFGGTLTQDMYHETNDTDRTKLVHDVVLIPKLDIDTLKINNLSSTPNTFKINSIHHQTVKVKPEGSTVLARHSKDNEIEALTYYPYYPAHTVQFHPEEIHDEFSITLINHLLSLNE
jgi:gamma-glutamyl-gamma-aminobutyrate hydrolase PuuD